MRSSSALVEREDFAFAVADRQRHQVEVAREDARRLFFEAQRDPEILERAAVVVHQRDALREIVAVEPRQQAELGHDLKAVADAEDQLAVGDELWQGRSACGGGRARRRRGRSPVVAIGKAADEHQAGVVVQMRGPLEQVVEVDQLRRGAGERPGVLRLRLAVEAIAGDDQTADSSDSVQRFLESFAERVEVGRHARRRRSGSSACARR